MVGSPRLLVHERTNGTGLEPLLRPALHSHFYSYSYSYSYPYPVLPFVSLTPQSAPPTVEERKLQLRERESSAAQPLVLSRTPPQLSCSLTRLTPLTFFAFTSHAHTRRSHLSSAHPTIRTLPSSTALNLNLAGPSSRSEHTFFKHQLYESLPNS